MSYFADYRIRLVWDKLIGGEKMTFAEHMRHTRGDLTQSAFCRKLGIPLTTYQRYESGARVPNIDVLVKIVWCIGVSADTLLGLDQMTDTQGGIDKKDNIIRLQAEAIENLPRIIDAQLRQLAQFS
jgi:transcriptional regulator with XRE-family HTH domain